ncbi:Lipopolysaccharide export system protein LptC [Candidatus Arsenophonus lipoptenae]|uniref:Lipopolysaccharide export system protein LptC n=1 Tax=Candidatus Arsenophonus lipoptenae TaxID=634113 RepID=A0A0X9VJ39_9GAMM|nr:LPS export ABC transporter periplasmic protein LptC [Candidatus Arsenophonus lipoptenae]AMA65005.1 Lipopolysaccharide export system protein LptC [Candidatus Arsenophonus lipoptenae]
MNRFKLCLNIILTIIILSLIGWNLSSFNQSSTSIIINKNQPNYQTGNAVMHLFNPKGKLDYKLIIDKFYYFSSDKISFFINPILTIYNIKKIPTWTIRANKAKLINDNMLYLYGDIQINNLNINSELKKILMEEGIINLLTRDISSNNQVTIIGRGLKSIGMKMLGNINTNTAELIEDVKTYYEIPNN